MKATEIIENFHNSLSEKLKEQKLRIVVSEKIYNDYISENNLSLNKKVYFKNLLLEKI